MVWECIVGDHHSSQKEELDLVSNAYFKAK